MSTAARHRRRPMPPQVLLFGHSGGKSSVLAATQAAETQGRRSAARCSNRPGDSPPSATRSTAATRSSRPTRNSPTPSASAPGATAQGRLEPSRWSSTTAPEKPPRPDQHPGPLTTRTRRPGRAGRHPRGRDRPDGGRRGRRGRVAGGVRGVRRVPHGRLAGKADARVGGFRCCSSHAVRPARAAGDTLATWEERVQKRADRPGEVRRLLKDAGRTTASPPLPPVRWDRPHGLRGRDSLPDTRPGRGESSVRTASPSCSATALTPPGRTASASPHRTGG